MILKESLAIFKDVAKFSILREAIDRVESRQLAETTLIEMIKSAEAFKKQLSRDELSPLAKKIECIEYPLQELLKYFVEPPQYRLKVKKVILLIDFLDLVSNDLIASLSIPS